MRKARITALVLAALPGWASPYSWADEQKDDVNAIGDRSVAHRSIISPEIEIAIARQYSDQIDKAAKMVRDPVINECVNRVAQNLAGNSDLKIPLNVKVLEDPAINAFSLLGGYL
jgi:predicted Zn-dependent protease